MRSQSALSEHAIQAAFVAWAGLQLGVFPELKLLYAIPNGGKRHKVVAAKLKAEGVKRGVPDLHLPVSRGVYHGLWIETKTPEGVLSDEQNHFHELLRKEGHAVIVCRSIEQCIEGVRAYLRT